MEIKYRPKDESELRVAQIKLHPHKRKLKKKVKTGHDTIRIHLPLYGLVDLKHLSY